ncbi:MAG: hypothetical protein KKB20_28920 [Proteobacteria bacterium]|nr:hypothetical protein [Pseudomonadota bacterium]
MADKTEIFEERFIRPVGVTGRYTILAAVVCLFLPGLYLYFFHGLFPPLEPLIRALIAVWAFMIVMGVIEPIVYYPILGYGGTFMSFLVGNILNLRVPVSATAQAVAGTREGSPEAEIVSTLGIAGSIIANEAVLIIGVILFLPFIGEVQGSGTAMAVALDQVLPALFGALGAMMLVRNYKLGLVPIGMGLVIALIKDDLPFSVTIPPMVLVSVLSARFMYKKGWVKGDTMM